RDRRHRADKLARSGWSRTSTWRGVHLPEGWSIMNGAAQIAALVGALAYIGAAALEMFLFNRPAARSFLHVEADNLDDLRMWAFVVGFRNMLAGIATIVGLIMLRTGDETVGRAGVLTGVSVPAARPPV